MIFYILSAFIILLIVVFIVFLPLIDYVDPGMSFPAVSVFFPCLFIKVYFYVVFAVAMGKDSKAAGGKGKGKQAASSSDDAAGKGKGKGGKAAADGLGTCTYVKGLFLALA